MGEDASPRPVPPQNTAELRGDPFAGLGSYQAVMEIEWWRPIGLGDNLRCERGAVSLPNPPTLEAMLEHEIDRLKPGAI